MKIPPVLGWTAGRKEGAEVVGGAWELGSVDLEDLHPDLHDLQEHVCRLSLEELDLDCLVIHAEEAEDEVLHGVEVARGDPHRKLLLSVEENGLVGVTVSEEADAVDADSDVVEFADLGGFSVEGGTRELEGGCFGHGYSCGNAMMALMPTTENGTCLVKL